MSGLGYDADKPQWGDRPDAVEPPDVRGPIPDRDATITAGVERDEEIVRSFATDDLARELARRDCIDGIRPCAECLLPHQEGTL